MILTPETPFRRILKAPRREGHRSCAEASPLRLPERRSIVGLLLFAAVVFNVSMLPYPIWFKAACLLAIPAAMILGVRRARPRAASQEKGVQP
jgi:hypothetical protein